MKRRHVDAAVLGLLGLLAFAAVLVSASGGEPVGVVLLDIGLSAAAIVAGLLLIGYRRHTQRRVLPALAGTILSLAVIISAAVTHWPLRVTYALSRDFLMRSRIVYAWASTSRRHSALAFSPLSVQSFPTTASCASGHSRSPAEARGLFSVGVTTYLSISGRWSGSTTAGSSFQRIER